MKIDIKALLVKLLPMFYKLATQLWFNLSSGQRDAAIKAVKAVEWLKKYITTDEVVYVAQMFNDNFGLNIPVEKIKELQDKINSGLSDLEYNQELKKFGELITANLTPEPIDWKFYALGLVQIAYEQVFKK